MKPGDHIMLKPTLLALAITSALLTACGGGGGAPTPVVTTPPVTTPPVTTPPVTTPPVTTPPVTTPPVSTINPLFKFDQHEVTVQAGTSVTLTTNVKISQLLDFKPGTGLKVFSPILPTGVEDPVHVQLTAAPNALTYDIYGL
jgi:hypothetical protein